MFKRMVLPLWVWLMLAPGAMADSPLTSTGFAEAYQDIPLVKKAQQQGTLDLEMAQFLSSPDNPLDVKAALINALSWKFEGKHNATLFSYYLGLKYGQSLGQIEKSALSADELLSWGYLAAMDDYFHPLQAVPLLEQGLQKKPGSMTAAILLALVQSQAAMDSDWCQVWQITDKVFNDKKLKADLRPKAQVLILDYMVLYKDSCKTAPRGSDRH